MATLTLRPTSATGTSWQNTGRVYDGSTNQAATVSINSSNYSQRTLTVNFSTSSIPQNAQITKATLTVIAKQSSSNSSRRITVQADINGSSSSRVIDQQLTSTSNTTLTADIANYMSNLSSLVITGVTSGSSYQSQTFSIYEIYVDVEYQEANVTLTNLTLNTTNEEMEIDDTITLRCTLTPSTANSYNITWSSNNDKVQLTKNGTNCTVKALASGTSTVTVTDTITGLSATCTIKIKHPYEGIGQHIDIYLPQQLGTGDKLYWDSANGRYFIQHSTGVTQTEITQKIEFDTPSPYVKIITDEAEVAPSSMSVELAMKEVTDDGGDSGEDGEEIVVGTTQGYQTHDGWMSDETTVSTELIPVDVEGNLYVKITPTDPNDTRNFFACYLYKYDADIEMIKYSLAGGQPNCTNKFEFVYFCPGSTSSTKYVAINIVVIQDDVFTPITPNEVIVTYKIVKESSDGTVVGTTQGHLDDGEWSNSEYYITTDMIPYVGNIYIKANPDNPDDINGYYGIIVYKYDKNGEYLGFEEIFTVEYAYAECTNEFALMYYYDSSLSDVKYVRIALGRGTEYWAEITPEDAIITYQIVTESSGIVVGTTQGYQTHDGWMSDETTVSTELIPYTGDIYIKVTPTDTNDTYCYCTVYIDKYNENGEFIGYVELPYVIEFTNEFVLLCNYDTSWSEVKYVSVEIMKDTLYGSYEWVQITPEDVIVEYKIVNTSSGGGTEQEGDWIEATMQRGYWESTTEFVPSDESQDGSYMYSTEVIYLDGITAIQVEASNHNQDIGIGITIFTSDGASQGTIDGAYYIDQESNTLNVEYMLEESNLVLTAIAFAAMAPDHLVSIRYKLIRGEVSGGDSGGTEQEGDWMDTALTCGYYMGDSFMLQTDSGNSTEFTTDKIDIQGATNIQIKVSGNSSASMWLDFFYSNSWVKYEEYLIDSSGITSVDIDGNTYKYVAICVAGKSSELSVMYKLTR